MKANLQNAEEMKQFMKAFKKKMEEENADD